MPVPLAPYPIPPVPFTPPSGRSFDLSVSCWLEKFWIPYFCVNLLLTKFFPWFCKIMFSSLTYFVKYISKERMQELSTHIFAYSYVVSMYNCEDFDNLSQNIILFRPKSSIPHRKPWHLLIQLNVLCYALLLHYHKSFFSWCSWNVWLYWINLFLRSGHEDIKLYGIYEIFAHYSGVQSQLVCSGCQKLLLYAHGATSVCCAVCNAVTNVPPPGMFSSILLSSMSPATIATILTW